VGWSGNGWCYYARPGKGSAKFRAHGGMPSGSPRGVRMAALSWEDHVPELAARRDGQSGLRADQQPLRPLRARRAGSSGGEAPRLLPAGGSPLGLGTERRQNPDHGLLRLAAQADSGPRSADRTIRCIGARPRWFTSVDARKVQDLGFGVPLSRSDFRDQSIVEMPLGDPTSVVYVI